MKTPPALPRFVAEAFGTYTLVFAAAGSVMVEELSDGLVTPLGVALSPGLVVMAMVYAIGHISEAHINPAVTFGFALTRRLPWRDAPVYWGAQLCGAALAAGTLRIMLGLVAGMGGHTPSGSAAQSLGMEVALTFFLMFVVMAVSTNQERFGSASGLAIGGVVVLAILLGGPISGGSMNPARTFGPALVGWVWTDHWVYWAGPLLGAALGALTYWWLTALGIKQHMSPQNIEGR